MFLIRTMRYPYHQHRLFQGLLLLRYHQIHLIRLHLHQCLHFQRYPNCQHGFPMHLRLVHHFHLLRRQAALLTSWRDFKANLKRIGYLAIGLVLATTLAVGAALKLMVPDIPWAVAFTFGAIVSPPDAVAATAIYVFMSSVRDLSSIILLAGPRNNVIPMVILDLWNNGEIPRLAALSMLVAGCVTAIGLLFMRFVDRFGLRA